MAGLRAAWALLAGLSVGVTLEQTLRFLSSSIIDVNRALETKQFYIILNCDVCFRTIGITVLNESKLKAGAGGPHADAASAAVAAVDTPELDVRDIMGAAREAVIRHNGERYRLRITANQKLILTK